MNNCEKCNNIKFLEPQDSGDYDSDIEDGIYKTDNGYYWFAQSEDSWYSGFIHQVTFCPFCGRKIDD